MAGTSGTLLGALPTWIRLFGGSRFRIDRLEVVIKGWDFQCFDQCFAALRRGLQDGGSRVGLFAVLNQSANGVVGDVVGTNRANDHLVDVLRRGLINNSYFMYVTHVNRVGITHGRYKAFTCSLFCLASGRRYTLATNLFARVIGVDVSDRRCLSNDLILGFYPDNSASAGHVPSRRSCTVKVFNRPRDVKIRRLVFILAVRGQHVFAYYLPIVASRASAVMFKRTYTGVLGLIVRSFLRASGVRLVILGGLTRAIFPVLPVIRAILQVIMASVRDDPAGINLLLFHATTRWRSNYRWG